MPLNHTEIASLSAPERILLVQDLWDSVIETAETLPLAPDEARWLAERVAYAQRLDAEWYSFDQIIADRTSRR